jgi:SAM-dependent methyltransferase
MISLGISWPTEEYQFDHPYYSTIEFERFLNEHGCFLPGTRIMDIGSGLGANLCYFARRHADVGFLGVDYNHEKVEIGKRLLEKRQLTGATLAFGDWFDLPTEYRGTFDGIFNCHTLCCFKRIEPAIQTLISLRPRWVAFNALFYDGPLDVLIHIRDYTYPAIADDNPDGDFNVFSLSNMTAVLEAGGYRLSAVKPFYPPVELSKPRDGARGSFTVNTEMHPRTLFSGPVHLPWHFVLAERDERARARALES